MKSDSEFAIKKEHESEYYQKMGKLIRELRVSAGLTQEDLAYLMGFTRVSINTIENGKQRLPLHGFGVLATIFNTELLVEPYPSAKTLEDLRALKKEQALQKLSEKY